MRVLVLGRSPFFVRGLVSELADGGIDVVAAVRSVADLAELLPRGVDAVLAGVPGTPEEIQPRVRAMTSVLAEHPTTALLVLGRAPRVWLASSPRWGCLSLESAATDDVLGALARLTATAPAPRAAHGTLTVGEQRVLDLLATGLSNDGIAAHLGVSLKTVETHVSHVFGKLGLEAHDHTTNRRVVAALRWSGV